MSSLSVRFFNSFKSKYLNFFFYLFDCQVSCASSLCRLSLLLHHREMLKQLSLTSPEFGPAHCAVVGLDGLEPSTSRLSGVRSSHLSYRPVLLRYFSSSISLLLLSSPLAVLSNRSAGFRTFNSTSSSCWSSLDHTASAISLYGNAVDRNWWR